MEIRQDGRRVATCFAVASLGRAILASAMYAAAVGIPAGFGDDPGRFLSSHAGALIRWGSIVDMFGYLSALPVAMYLRRRYPIGFAGDVFAAAAVVFVVVGAIGAVVMATAAPALIDEYASASAVQRAQLVPIFGTLYRGVVVGMWQTLETIPAAVWLIGTSVATRRHGERALSVLLLVLGAILTLLAVARIA